MSASKMCAEPECHENDSSIMGLHLWRTNAWSIAYLKHYYFAALWWSLVFLFLFGNANLFFCYTLLWLQSRSNFSILEHNPNPYDQKSMWTYLNMLNWLRNYSCCMEHVLFLCSNEESASNHPNHLKAYYTCPQLILFMSFILKSEISSP